MQLPRQQVDSTPVRGPRYYYRVTADGSESQASNSAQGTPLRIVVIDPGHGAADKGVIGLYSVTWGSEIVEKDLNLNLALLVFLELYNNPSVYAIAPIGTRSWLDFNCPSPTDRAHIARDFAAQALISIHFNGFTGVLPNRMEIYIHPEQTPQSDQVNKDEDESYARGILAKASNAYNSQALWAYLDDATLHMNDYDVLKDGDLGNPRSPGRNCKASLLEVNFIKNNIFHFAWNESPRTIEIREEVAKSLAEALANQLDQFWDIH